MGYVFKFMARGSLVKIEEPESLDAGTSLDSCLAHKDRIDPRCTKADRGRPLIPGPVLKEKTDLSKMIWKQTRKSLSVTVTFSYKHHF